MKKIVYLLFMMVSFISTMFAQEDESWYQNKIIADIEFEGLKNVAKSELDGIVNQYIGEEFTDELFLELQTLMYELDYFEFIVPTPKAGDDLKQTVVIVFQVQESPSISKIRFEGNDSIWNSTLSGKITIKAKDIYSDYKMEKAIDEILTEYYDKGYPNASVEYEKVSNPEKNTLLIKFIIDEGEQTLIREINFHGNNVFETDDKLKSIIETKKKSLFKDGVYKEDVIQSDILLIEGHYHDNGYINARVIDVKTELTQDEKKENLKNMVVDFYIEEGEQYTYGGIEYTGNNIFTVAEFDELDTQKFGDIYNKSTFERNFMRVQDLYYNIGYIENSFQDQVEIDEENRVISHKIAIIERGVAHIGEITVSGNEKTKDIVIFREIPIKSGDVFSKSKLVESYRNIMSTRLFTNTNPIPTKNDEGNMDLHFEVEEARTLSLMGGISVSGADFEPTLTFSLKNTNFMGMGRTFGGTLNLGFDMQQFSLEYDEPRILNSNFSGGGSLSFSHRKIDIHQLSYEYLKNSNGDYIDYDGNIVNDENKVIKLDEDGYKIEIPLIKGVTTKSEYEEWLKSGGSIGDYEEDLHAYEIAFSLYGGHVWYKSYGIIKASTGYRTAVEQYQYDDDITPYNEEYRRNQGEWYYNDKWWIKGIIDNRDKPVGTTEGYAFSQHLTIGGIIPLQHDKDHKSDYIKSVTTADYYFKLIDEPVTDEWDFTLTLRTHAAYTRIFNKPGLSLIEDDRTAILDGMFVGRGWAPRNEGVALLDLKVELLLPLVDNMLGLSLFIEGANLWTDLDKVTTLNLDDFKFAYGASLGIINQVMPISVYVCKTFQTEGGSIKWSPEDRYNKVFWGHATWGISFNLNYFLQ